MDNLQVKRLNAYYGDSHILHNVTLDVEQSQFVTLLGRNGAGKTTTLESIMGMVDRVEGEISFGGNEISGLEPYAVSQMGIAIVPEHRRIFPELSVRKNLRMGYIGHEVEAPIETLLDRIFGYFPRLEERYEQEASSMSGGEQQMLAIARALMSEPDVVLVDEPTEGLMPSLVEKLRRILKEISEREISILLVEQNAKLALEIADYAYFISEGKIMDQGPADTMRQDRKVQEEYLQV